MQLTPRQIDMVTYLVNHPGWVTSEQLSQRLRLHRKTIQADMRVIQLALGQGSLLLINSRKGYQLQSLSQEAREMLIDTTSYFGGIWNCLLPRPSALVLYLLFREGYVSMQELADTFFYSKTAISIEMEHVRRWCERRTDLKLEISQIKGIRLDASELRKRIFFINFGSRAAFQALPLSETMKSYYSNLLLTCRDILRRILVRSDYLLTGEALLKITRFTAGSMVRSRMGHLLQEQEIAHPVPSIISDFVLELQASTGQTISESERMSIALIFNSCDTLDADIPFDKDTYDALSRFENGICRMLSLPQQELFDHREAFLSHIHAVK